MESTAAGSERNFFIPTHRLDQPCTGVYIFTKNDKAACRVQVTWSKKKVKKVYWVVVEGGPIGRGRVAKGKRDVGLELLRSQLDRRDGKVYRLSTRIANVRGKGRRSKGGEGSITTTPLPPDPTDESGGLRGVVGGPLPNRSVVLQAPSVHLPTVSLGEIEFLKDEPFVADVPEGWTDFPGCASTSWKNSKFPTCSVTITLSMLQVLLLQGLAGVHEKSAELSGSRRE
ncbi:hypothetical protein ACHAWF_008410, partial [Thalassiosira exigua]